MISQIAQMMRHLMLPQMRHPLKLPHIRHLKTFLSHRNREFGSFWAHFMWALTYYRGQKDQPFYSLLKPEFYFHGLRMIEWQNSCPDYPIGFMAVLVKLNMSKDEAVYCWRQVYCQRQQLLNFTSLSACEALTSAQYVKHAKNVSKDVSISYERYLHLGFETSRVALPTLKDIKLCVGHDYEFHDFEVIMEELIEMFKARVGITGREDCNVAVRVECRGYRPKKLIQGAKVKGSAHSTALYIHCRTELIVAKGIEIVGPRKTDRSGKVIYPITFHIVPYTHIALDV